MRPIPVVDLFAGPGGLNEGFSSPKHSDGGQVFKTVASFEMDAVACETLRLRSAVRELRGSSKGLGVYHRFLRKELDWNSFATHPDVAEALETASREVHQIELGRPTRGESDRIIVDALSKFGGIHEPWVLIGGPPCQAYSLVGRARRRNDEAFEDDVKHFLYLEYLEIIRRFKPHVFVMENVKGLLSHTHGGRGMFARILEDLAEPGYEIRSFVVNDSGDTLPLAGLAPEDYVIRAERYGVPQRRHRVILLGVRRDLEFGPSSVLVERPSPPTVGEVIGHFPSIRSRVSPRSGTEDNAANWERLRAEALKIAESHPTAPVPRDTGWDRGGRRLGSTPATDLEAWLTGGTPVAVTQHEARSHMDSDLLRYGYLAAKAASGRVIKVDGLPKELTPAHANVGGPETPFADRFRVQQLDAPSTTITSHISKDGHYYIHPDPNQMRSLTVREAARLQTFPDDYFFRGNRTQQYHQVGNAVPPYLAMQLAVIVSQLMATRPG